MHRRTPPPSSSAPRVGAVLTALTAAAALLITGITPVAAAPAAPATVEPGGIAVWGWGYYGQTRIPADPGEIVSVAAGSFHSLALRDDGTLLAWGSDRSGQTAVPANLKPVVAVAAGWIHSLALQNDGTVVGWGSNERGETDPPADLDDAVAVSAGEQFSLALREGGTVTAWGKNTTGSNAVPAGLTGVTAISAGDVHSLALKDDGTVVAWGTAGSPQVDGLPSGLDDVVAVSAGWDHSLALTSDGTVVAWGSNEYGQISVPADLTDVVAVSGGARHSLAMKKDGTLVAWGDNEDDQLTHPSGLGIPTAIDAGGYHNIALGARPALSADAPPATATVGQDYSYAFGADPSTYAYTVVSGALPAGLALSQQGVLAGTPTEGGPSTFTVAAVNRYGRTIGAAHTITVAQAPAEPTLSGAAPVGRIGSSYDFAYTVGGFPAPTVSLASGSLPQGLTLSSDGRLTGTPTAAGTSTFTVLAENASGSARMSTTLEVTPGFAGPTIEGAAPDGTVGTAFDYGYTATGYPTPAFVALTELPPGLALDTATGRLTGTPTAAGTFTFTVAATNDFGRNQTVDTVTIAAAATAPTLSGIAAAGVVGTAYDSTYTVTGSPAPTVTVVAGTLPPGLALAASGRLTGTPTTAGTFTFTVQARNSAGAARAVSTVTVSPQKTATKADLRVDLSAPTSAVKGRTFTYSLIARNAGPATATSVYSKVILPSGVQFVSATGTYTRVGSIVIFHRPSLAVGRTVTERITVRATSTGTGTALASTFSVKTPDPSIRSNADTAATTVR
ncbi:RCC1 domain-containing protein [Rathayibacter sp. Leaf299]|uniref:RCC1 domain-containing protein n=1 Tax=Rathayibacter sp. Leaf299 TaxID=1736328 RepID=UPI0012F73BAC|nr:putative Ig domain-containing protein [Rathayibacter sp. Leaf299]